MVKLMAIGGIQRVFLPGVYLKRFNCLPYSRPVPGLQPLPLVKMDPVMVISPLANRRTKNKSVGVNEKSSDWTGDIHRQPCG
jgi:hypothetical protein